MNKEEIEKICKETFIENIMSNLDSTLIFTYIQTLEKENTNLKQALNEIRKIINECKMLMPHEFDWEEQGNNILQIIDKVLGDENA